MKFSAILSLALAAATVSSFSFHNRAESMQLRSEEVEKAEPKVTEAKPNKTPAKKRKNLLSTSDSVKTPAETRLSKFFDRIEPKLTKFLVKYKSNPAVVKIANEKLAKLEKFVKSVNAKANKKVAAKKEDEE